MRDSFISGAMALTVDEEGNFTIDHEPQGSRFTFSTASHQVSVKSYGTYVLTISTKFTLGDPAVTFPGGQPDDIEMSEVGTNSFTLRIFVSRESKEFPQVTNFEIHPADSQIDKIVDPTILVEPPDKPAETERAGDSQGILVIGVTLDADEQFVYEELFVDTPDLEWIQDTRSVKVVSRNTGAYYVVFRTNFELADPAIDFPGRPGGKPPLFIRLESLSYLAILEVAVRQDQREDPILLRLMAASGGTDINTEPTILVEPPDKKS